MPLNDFFHSIYCINLDRRPDRWSRVKARFEDHSIVGVSRYPAQDARLLEIPDSWKDVPGAYGCLLSHVGVVRAARESGAANVLIFEDDVVFDDRLNVLFDGVIDQVPDDWDMLLLGGSHWSPPERLSDNVCRVTATVATHAYALKRTIYDEFIRFNLSSAVPVDCNSTVLQNMFLCYCFSPVLAWQEDGYSDIAEKVLRFERPQGS
jgi:glycosyl transferase, family 25